MREQLLKLKETNAIQAKEIEDLKRKVEAVGGDNEGILVAAKLSDEAKQEEFVALKVKHQEEIASLQHIWQGML